MATFYWPPQSGGGSVNLIGQALDEFNIIVGDGSNLSAALDTSSVGDILIDSINGVVINNEGFRRIDYGTSTGYVSGGNLSINGGDNTKFDVSAGTGWVTDTATDPLNPVVTLVSFGPFTAQTVVNLATAGASGISILANGTIAQATIQYTGAELRSRITLGTLLHTSGTQIDSVIDVSADFAAWDTQGLSDLAYALGPINESGNIYSANGANLNINKSAGLIFQAGIGSKFDPTNPNRLSISALTATPVVYTYQDGVGGWSLAPGTSIVPGSYDDGTGTLGPVSINKWTIQRIYFVPTATTIVQYGQTIYNSLAEAQAVVNSEVFSQNPQLDVAFFRSWLIVRGDATDLSLISDAQFLNAGKFGSVSGGGSSSTTNLQQAWDNSPVPQIVLNNGDLGMAFRDSSTPTASKLWAFQDNAGTTDFLTIDPNGIGDENVATNIPIGDPSNTGLSNTFVESSFVGALNETKDTILRPEIGMSSQRPDYTVLEDTGTLYADVEALGGGDLTYYVSNGNIALDCTTGSGVGGTARVALTAGASQSVPAINYVYVTDGGGGVATLNASTTFPTGEFAWLARIVVPDATTFGTTGPYTSQRYSDSLNFTSERGALSYDREKARTLGTTWDSGVAPTVTVTANGVSADNVEVATTSGIVYQLHRQTFPSLSLPNTYYIVNDNTTPYRTTTDLNSELTDATGTSMSGRRFVLTLWGVISKESSECKLMINLPTGSYGNNNDALNDVNNTAVTSIPSEFRQTGFLIGKLVFRHQTASSGTWTNIALSDLGIQAIDLRGLQPGFNLGGASVASANEFSDAVFNIFNDADITKIAQFDAADITTSTTRTMTFPNASGIITVVSGGRVDNAVPRWDGTTGLMQNSGLNIDDDGNLSVVNGSATPITLTLQDSLGIQAVLKANATRAEIGTMSNHDTRVIANNIARGTFTNGGILVWGTTSSVSSPSGANSLIQLYSTNQPAMTWRRSTHEREVYIDTSNVLNISGDDGNTDVSIDTNGCMEITNDQNNDAPLTITHAGTNEGISLMWQSNNTIKGGELYSDNDTFGGMLTLYSTDGSTIGVRISGAPGQDNYILGETGFGTTTPQRLVEMRNDDSNNPPLRLTHGTTREGVIMEWYNNSTVLGGQIYSDNDTFGGMITLYDTNGSTIGARINGSSSDGYILNGDFGFGTTNPANKVHISATGSGLRLGGLTSTDPLATDANGDIIAGASDGRLKYRVTRYQKGLETLEQLNPVSFKWNSGMREYGTDDIGFIAQDVEHVIPEAVSTRNQLNLPDCKTFNDSKLTPVIVKSVQQLHQIIKRQQTQIDELVELIQPYQES